MEEIEGIGVGGKKVGANNLTSIVTRLTTMASLPADTQNIEGQFFKSKPPSHPACIWRKQAARLLLLWNSNYMLTCGIQSCDVILPSLSTDQSGSNSARTFQGWVRRPALGQCTPNLYPTGI